MSDITEETIRRIIREELDNYDRDKGLTPRMSRSGERSGYGYPVIPMAPMPATSNRCSVCAIDFGAGAWGFACTNPKCPTGFRSTTA